MSKKYLSLDKMRSLAGDPKTDPKVLDSLSKEGYGTVNSLVASNPNSSYTTLQRVAKSGDGEIELTKNPKVGPDILLIIATSEWLHVRNYVLGSPNCTPLLTYLVKMQSPYSWDEQSPLRPSKKFDEDQYRKFLDVATVEELESDLIINKDTLVSVMKESIKLNPPQIDDDVFWEQMQQCYEDDILEEILEDIEVKMNKKISYILQKTHTPVAK